MSADNKINSAWLFVTVPRLDRTYFQLGHIAAWMPKSKIKRGWSFWYLQYKNKCWIDSFELLCRVVEEFLKQGVISYRLLPESGLVEPSRAPTKINERVSVHWLCASDDQTGGVMAWRFGRLTGMTLQSLGVAIRWQIARCDHAKSWHGAVMAWWLAGTQGNLSNFNGDLLSESQVWLVKALIWSRSYLSQISTSRFFSSGPARAPREAPC